MARLSVNDQAALTMLREAGIKPTAEEVMVLSDDILEIMSDELDADDDTNCIPESESAEEAVRILWSRVGRSNLRSYLNCLLVR